MIKPDSEKLKNQYGHLVCDDCKAKWVEATEKHIQKKRDLLNPFKHKKIYESYVNTICKSCKRKIFKEWKKNKGK